ncbi:MAG: MoxR family ATPase [Victivallales bacterium]|nr:MoxR family ATPase [Victivallales bacterium]
MIRKLEELRKNLRSVIRGKAEAAELITTALCANANVLMEDVPGVGKTTMAKALAASISADFKRIQFTPDLLPADILGCSIFNPKEGEFHFRPGPIFTNILLADEINRASPRTQSALLEAMSEKQVSIEGHTYPLTDPFLVIATQNPIEYQGTYPLPEAQLDRFAMLVTIGYPEEKHDLEIIYSHRCGDPLDNLTPVLSIDDIRQIHTEVKNVKVEESVAHYIAAVIRATREDARIMLGASPRAMITLLHCAQARAYIHARAYVLPEDVKMLAVDVLAHRLVLENKSRYSGVNARTVVSELLERVKVPV